jgi:hypothetical protein
MATRTIQQVIQFFKDLERNWADASDNFAYEFKTSIVRQIARQGHIDTTAMIRSVNYHREAVTSAGVRYRIDTSDGQVRDVFYDGWVEFPRKNWPGGFFYQKGIENADVNRVADEVMDRTFVV